MRDQFQPKKLFCTVLEKGKVPKWARGGGVGTLELDKMRTMRMLSILMLLRVLDIKRISEVNTVHFTHVICLNTR